MKYTRITLVGLALGISAGCQGASGEKAAEVTDHGQPAAVGRTGEDGETLLQPDEIPENVRAAAIAEVPGLVIEEAEDEGEVYCVHGTANGVFYEVEVTPAGEIVEVEQDGDEEGADHDDDGDDDRDEDDEDDED